MRKAILILAALISVNTICTAQPISAKLAECRQLINEINAMELKQAEAYSEYNIKLVYVDVNGLIRKQVYRYGGEVEQLTFISLYNESGDAVFIAYQAGNNMADEKGFVYLDKGEIVLQNNITYPYYEEYYVDGNLVVEGEKGSFTAKTSGKFLYETPLFKIPLNQYAHTDSLRKYCNEYGKPIQLSEDTKAISFNNARFAYISSCNDGGIKSQPSMSAPALKGIDTDFIYIIALLDKDKGETIEGWGFNHWYKVDCAGDIGYIYGAFLEPIIHK